MAGIVRRIVQVGTAPKAIGAYSQAVVAGNTMYISGQLGMDPNTMNLVDGGAAAEAEQALKNMGEILKSQGINFNNVVKCTVLLADINDFGKVNDVYARYFSSNKPARAAYQVACLPKHANVEIEAIAVLGTIVDDVSHL